jgi:hypothetical protein
MCRVNDLSGNRGRMMSEDASASHVGGAGARCRVLDEQTGADDYRIGL